MATVLAGGVGVGRAVIVLLVGSAVLRLGRGLLGCTSKHGEQSNRSCAPRIQGNHVTGKEVAEMIYPQSH